MTEPTLPKDEYSALHKEMASCMAELALLERACLIGTAAIFAWVATNAESLVGFAGLVWMVPVAVAMFGTLKALAIRRHISLLADDLRDLQGEAGGGDRAQRYFGRRWGARRWASAAAWLLYLGLTLSGSGLGFLQFRSECPGPLANACGQDDGSDTQEEQESLTHGT
jgi:hypothetical protein